VDSQPIDEHQRDLTEAFAGSKLTVEQLWLRYFTLGGDAGKVEIEAYLAGLMPLPSLQHNILAHAINERLDELGPPRRAPYRPDTPPRSERGHSADEA
jgi:hypothetical protein